MFALFTLLLCGAAGGFVFERLHLPGGPLVGSMIAVILWNSFTGANPVSVPRPLAFCVYVCLGVILGTMYKPGMLGLVRDTWPALVGSTVILLLAGLLATWMVVHFKALSVAGAYLATSPGGINAVVGGLVPQLGAEGPVVLLYHLVRLYAILLIAPYGVKLIQHMLR